MPTLRPFRDYDEKDVINFFAWSGSIPVNKGTLVKVQGNGIVPGQENIEMLGNMGDFSASNTVLQRYGTVPKVSVASSTDKPLGILLFDVREVDENGELLKYRPRKAAEMEAVLSGQTAPILTRGLIQYQGVLENGAVSVVAGADAYAGAGGVIATSGTNKIGKFLSTSGADGSVMILLNCV